MLYIINNQYFMDPTPIYYNGVGSVYIDTTLPRKLGSMVSNWVNNLPINGIYWGEITH